MHRVGRFVTEQYKLFIKKEHRASEYIEAVLA
jgi:hypothetical protein